MNENTLFHLGVAADRLRAGYALLPGDPGRVQAIAARLEQARPISQNREFTLWRGELAGEPVLVCSTGIGGPSAAIAVEELHMAGVHTVIRVGTCGAMQPALVGGDAVVATAAVRQEGTALHYAPPEYPAAADFAVTRALCDAAASLGLTCHTGVVQSKDSFYGQHAPERMPVAASLTEKWEAWKRLGVLASEMECAAIFTVAASLGMRAGAVLHVLWNQERERLGLDNPEVHDTLRAIACAVEAVRRLAGAKRS